MQSFYSLCLTIPLSEVRETVSVVCCFCWFLRMVSCFLVCWSSLNVCWVFTLTQLLGCQPSREIWGRRTLIQGAAVPSRAPSHTSVQSPVRKLLKKVWNWDPFLPTSAPPFKCVEMRWGQGEWGIGKGGDSSRRCLSHSITNSPQLESTSGSTTISLAPIAGGAFSWACLEQGRHENRLQRLQTCHLTGIPFVNVFCLSICLSFEILLRTEKLADQRFCSLIPGDDNWLELRSSCL